MITEFAYSQGLHPVSAKLITVPSRVEILDLPKDFDCHDRNDQTMAVLQASPGVAASEGVLNP